MIERAKVSVDDLDFYRDIRAGFERCCRDFLVHLDDEPAMDRLFDTVLSADCEAYDEGKIPIWEYIRRIYASADLDKRDIARALHEAEQLFLQRLKKESSLAYHLQTTEEWREHGKNKSGSSVLQAQYILSPVLDKLLKVRK